MPKIEKVFVLMLENRSFDHLLGLSTWPGIDGILDPTGAIKTTCVNKNGLTGALVSASGQAPEILDDDPPHEFCDVLMQLCGSGPRRAGTGTYPAIDCSGF